VQLLPRKNPHKGQLHTRGQESEKSRNLPRIALIQLAPVTRCDQHKLLSYPKLAVPLMKWPVVPSAGYFALETTAGPACEPRLPLCAEPAANLETISYLIVPFVLRGFLCRVMAGEDCTPA
jgi:hypothetical protein